MQKRPKYESPEDILAGLMERCARAEVCCSDARRLLLRRGVELAEQERMIDELIRQRFIDEERYASAFVRDKLNFSRWGSRKIAEALYRKQIPGEIIQQALAQASEVSMTDRLEHDLRRKNVALRDEDPYKRREKLLRFGASRGYDFETVMETIERILSVE
jgi:regulatory protein